MSAGRTDAAPGEAPGHARRLTFRLGTLLLLVAALAVAFALLRPEPGINRLTATWVAVQHVRGLLADEYPGRDADLRKSGTTWLPNLKSWRVDFEYAVEGGVTGGANVTVDGWSRVVGTGISSGGPGDAGAL